MQSRRRLGAARSTWKRPAGCGAFFVQCESRKYLCLSAADKLENDFAAVRPTPVLHEIDALPGPERELASDNGHLQRDTIEHRLDMSRHVVGPFGIVNPRSVLGRETVECGKQIGLDVGIRVFLDRQ